MIVYGEPGGKIERFVNRAGDVVFLDEDGNPERTESWAKAGGGRGPLAERSRKDNGRSDNVEQEWCQWGTQMVPCAPGFGGAWYEAGHRSPDYGIWPKDLHMRVKKKPDEVYAGRRDKSYMEGRSVESDAFDDSGAA